MPFSNKMPRLALCLLLISIQIYFAELSGPSNLSISTNNAAFSNYSELGYAATIKDQSWSPPRYFLSEAKGLMEHDGTWRVPIEQLDLAKRLQALTLLLSDTLFYNIHSMGGMASLLGNKWPLMLASFLVVCIHYYQSFQSKQTRPLHVNIFSRMLQEIHPFRPRKLLSFAHSDSSQKLVSFFYTQYFLSTLLFSFSILLLVGILRFMALPFCSLLICLLAVIASELNKKLSLCVVALGLVARAVFYYVDKLDKDALRFDLLVFITSYAVINLQEEEKCKFMNLFSKSFIFYCMAYVIELFFVQIALYHQPFTSSSTTLINVYDAAMKQILSPEVFACYLMALKAADKFYAVRSSSGGAALGLASSFVITLVFAFVYFVLRRIIRNLWIDYKDESFLYRLFFLFLVFSSWPKTLLSRANVYNPMAVAFVAFYLIDSPIDKLWPWIKKYNVALVSFFAVVAFSWLVMAFSSAKIALCTIFFLVAFILILKFRNEVAEICLRSIIFNLFNPEQLIIELKSIHDRLVYTMAMSWWSKIMSTIVWLWNLLMGDFRYTTSVLVAQKWIPTLYSFGEIHKMDPALQDSVISSLTNMTLNPLLEFSSSLKENYAQLKSDTFLPTSQKAVLDKYCKNKTATLCLAGCSSSDLWIATRLSHGIKSHYIFRKIYEKGIVIPIFYLYVSYLVFSRVFSSSSASEKFPKSGRTAGYIGKLGLLKSHLLNYFRFLFGFFIELTHLIAKDIPDRIRSSWEYILTKSKRSAFVYATLKSLTPIFLTVISIVLLHLISLQSLFYLPEEIKGESTFIRSIRALPPFPTYFTSLSAYALASLLRHSIITAYVESNFLWSLLWEIYVFSVRVVIKRSLDKYIWSEPLAVAFAWASLLFANYLQMTTKQTERSINVVNKTYWTGYALPAALFSILLYYGSAIFSYLKYDYRMLIILYISDWKSLIPEDAIAIRMAADSTYLLVCNVIMTSIFDFPEKIIAA